ncbi:hypothetical protein PLESTF_001198100 [Pleodorina starrii]|nr:hypothetical protein PLESTF_001198100 [Pleodorina starrii]
MSKGVKTFGGLRGALRAGPPSITKGSLAFGGALLFGGTAYFTYRYAKAHVALRDEDTPGDPSASFSVFDKIANKYDEAIGQEEAALWYGMMRKWLLYEAQGDVLEVSVGTGRNFQYYNLDSPSIRSLTFTDVSPQMLLRAEDKFFDELHLGHKHPNVRTTFCLADAHCLVDPTAGRTAQVAAAADAIPKPPAAEAPQTTPWWAYWRRGKDAVGPGSSAAQDSATTASDAAGTAAPAAAPDASEPAVAPGPLPPEMPGLHASGLMNFFRVLMPQSPPESAPSRGAEQGGAAADLGGAAAASAEREGASQTEDAPRGEGCCSCAGATPSCSYAQRCNAGQLESGALLRRFAPGQFDTVVDTFGLCSHEDPVQALKEMARVCKPGGKLLLLEHGRANYDWLNRKLDSSASDHQRKWGCLWNKDILAIVKKAGLRVDKVTRWHFGTSYFIVARPPHQA